MDFLDPQKQRAHMIRLITGYFLIGIAVLFGTLILLYQAYGFSLDKDGEIIQNGLVFVSTQPEGAQIYLNGKQAKSDTNTKLQLPAGEYNTVLKRSGYRDWQRLITVDGGSLQHFDYPLLVPTKLTTSTIKTYESSPGLSTQSPDRRWLIVQQDASTLNFDLYDLGDPKKINTAVTTISLPDTLLTKVQAGVDSLQLEEWSTDNRHVLLRHVYEGGASEYITLDREEPAESVNLTKTLGLTPGKELKLRDKKFDKFYVYDTVARTLGTTSVGDAGKVEPLLDQVLGYKSYGSNRVLYVTDKGAPAGKVLSMLQEGDDTPYRIREHSAGAPYLIDLAQYDGDWYVVAGAANDSKVYIYKNPQQIRRSSLTAALVPVQILRVESPNFLAFSSNTQFVVVSNGNNFADYDAEADKRYTFTATAAIDPPAAHATWMDSSRLTYISGGKLTILDYDNINAQTLVPASPNYLPIFNRNYSYVYTLAPAATGGMALTATSLRTAEDL